VPAVTVVTLNPPAVAVERVRPPPGLEMVRESGYLMITTPEPPLPPAAARAPPPPEPELAVALSPAPDAPMPPAPPPAEPAGLTPVPSLGAGP
jgi:hypothetical protein